MVGLIGKKIGMTQVFSEEGLVIPVTVIKVEPNFVVKERTLEKDGYRSLVLGSIDLKEKNLSKPYKGQFSPDILPKKYLVEFRDFTGSYKEGDSLGLELFESVSFVDVTGTSKGKGFQGAMKRYGFAGGGSAHGSKFHRALGGTGQNTKPSKVFKGKKMAGRMGNERKTIESLEVVQVDLERKAILVKGAVPGVKGGLVLIRNAKKDRGLGM